MRNIPKKSTFSVLVSFWRGVTKLEAFQWSKVTKLNPPKPSPLVCQLETDNEFKWPLDSSAVRFCYCAAFQWFCVHFSEYIIFALVFNTQSSPYFAIKSQNHEIFLILKLARKWLSIFISLYAVEHNIMKKYIYKLHNFKRRHWELSLSRVWNVNKRFSLVFMKMLVSCPKLGLCIRALVS